MLFNIEADVGTRLVLYVVPDTFTATPSVSVRASGRELLVVAANEKREALVVAGRHETGQCGFSIDSTMIEGLENFPELEIVDIETGVLVYRRRPPDRLVQMKMFRLETHLLPLRRLDNALNVRFQYCSYDLDRYGRETATQSLLLNFTNSVYVTGRLEYRSYEYCLNNGFKTIAIFQDPYVELAERLFIFRHIRSSSVDLLTMRDRLKWEEAVDFAEGLPLDDERALTLGVEAMPRPVAQTLSNSVVRLLTSSSPDEMAGRNSVAAALEVLASFAIVGLREHEGVFLDSLADLTNIERADLPALSLRVASVVALANVLRKSRLVEAMLEKDLELYAHVQEVLKVTA